MKIIVQWKIDSATGMFCRDTALRGIAAIAQLLAAGKGEVIKPGVEPSDGAAGRCRTRM